MMKKECLELLDLIDDKKTSLKEYLEGFESSELVRLPTKGKWSAIMTVHHLMLAESGSIAYCKKKMSFDPVLIDATKDQIKMETKVPYLLKSPKYKVEAPLGLSAEYLDNTLTLNEVFEKWNAIRNEVREFIESQNESIFSKALYKHPLAGKMRLIGMVMFFEGHLDSHTTQIKRNFELIQSEIPRA